MLDPTRPLFETDPGGGDGGGAPPPDPTPPADPAGGGEPGEGEPSGWSGPSQEEWQETRSVIEGLAPLTELAQNLPGPAQPGFGPQPQGPEPAQELRPPNPWSDNYDAEMDAYLQARDQRLLERFRPVEEQVYMGQLEHQMDEAIGSLPAEVRTLGLGEDHAERADDAVVRMSAAFYDPARPLSEATQRSGEYLRELVDLAKSQGREEYIASLRGEGEGRQPQEPAGGGAALPGGEPAASYGEIIERHLTQTAS